MRLAIDPLGFFDKIWGLIHIPGRNFSHLVEYVIFLVGFPPWSFHVKNLLINPHTVDG